MPKRKIKGEIVSDKMQKTAVVLAERYVKHPKYKKYIRISKKYKAHDENKEYKVGDKVIIQECKPISKDKNFEIIGRA
ncbi:TPA: 30S ribosomal protein S17 [Patescibacteria group bacterium]|nr:MAG: 30S ribosomal protein S17 [Parcubacteria group bacterium GW2011_GWF2_40_10]KKR47413.1 MAG: 30S ribosomal protein S17 [Parcubacteria group bacterium GW2011_GWA2_40_143]KKR59813.1 MAG: 30S ribosomal protein S17 [Parcubacteria group bacterium GW2011_GWC2_40_31]KKR74406.1 MAG: 30S ribosomal protein S17 [Parcubacteria group bacterium GW2011_GWB2_40_8]KKR77197.1 MAG: 30S ribosomal protein S17 [Parcubacteria group bacterium GW2011_GWE2_40_8]KKR80812.1 MAG: 30S ribosomal protein S17 [Parcubact